MSEKSLFDMHEEQLRVVLRLHDVTDVGTLSCVFLLFLLPDSMFLSFSTFYYTLLSLMPKTAGVSIYNEQNDSHKYLLIHFIHLTHLLPMMLLLIWWDAGKHFLLFVKLIPHTTSSETRHTGLLIVTWSTGQQRCLWDTQLSAWWNRVGVRSSHGTRRRACSVPHLISLSSSLNERMQQRLFALMPLCSHVIWEKSNTSWLKCLAIYQTCNLFHPSLSMLRLEPERKTC